MKTNCSDEVVISRQQMENSVRNDALRENSFSIAAMSSARN